MSTTRAITTMVMDVEIEATAEFSYSPGCEMSMYGGPDHLGWPAEAPELELEALTIGAGDNKVDLFPALQAKEIGLVEEALLEGVSDDYEPGDY